MNHRKTFTLAAVLCVNSCAGFGHRKVIGWQCTATVAAGTVSVSSTRHLNPDGSFRYEAHNWEWRRHDTDTDGDVRVTDWPGMGANEPAQISVSIYLGRPLRGRIVEVDVGPDANTGPTKDPVWSQRDQREGYALTRPAAAFLALPRPVFVTGYDREGRRAFRIPIDMDAVASAMEAVERAKALSSGMADDFRSRCGVEREEGTIVMV